MNPKLLLLFLFSPVFGLTHTIPQIGGPTYIPQNLTEEQKINHLIHYIEKMDAQFIRNGVSYSSTEAADHLRMKREKAGKRIKTAKEFIDFIASKSSISGEAYQIKFKNGSVFNARDVLYYELKKLEAGKVGYYKGIKVTKAPAC